MAQHFAPTRVHWLPNGMRVLTRELHHAPVVTGMVWYGVGSRNEAPGATGISHFLEHMMFKGTRRFPYGVLEEGVKRRGGMWNAFTSYDYTSYFEVLPARHLEFGLEVESDRMTNMRFDPDLTVRERGIIVSEREGSENRPQFWLREAFMHEAFREFPYRHSVIGYKDDIRATTAEILTAHYERFYRPNNATLVVTGDFETGRLLELAHKHFGHLSRGAEVEPLTAAEPEQTEERRVEVRRPGPNPYMMAAFRIPEESHPDSAALTILGAVLSGGPSFSAMGGGGASMGRSSRLYRRLVNAGIAANAGAHAWTLQYAGLFSCSATPAPGVDPNKVEAAFFAEVDEMSQARVSDEELERAKKQVRAQWVYGMESAINQAMILGSTAMVRGVEGFDNALEEFDAVTADDVQRVARQYLSPDRRTVGWFLPDNSVSVPVAPTAAVPATETDSPTTPDFQKAGSKPVDPPAPGKRGIILDPDRVVRQQLPAGATLLVYPAETIPSAFVRVQMEAGSIHDPSGKAGLAALTAQLLPRGSEAFTAEELALKTDALGMSIRVDIGKETAVATLKCLPEDLETGAGLLAEVLCRPTFPAEELERMRDRMLVAVREAENDTRSVSAKRLYEVLYPDGHPYGSPASGTEESLKSVTGEDLQAFHRGFYGLNQAVITVVGNVDAARVAALLQEAFNDFTGGVGRPVIPPAPLPSASQVHVTIPGKTQTDLAMGWPLVDRSHPDWLALEVLATLFGGNGTPASSRLFRDVREKYGLSYYQYAIFGGSMGPAGWTVHLGVNPARLSFAEETVRKELARLVAEAVPAEELEALQEFLQDYPAVQHESPERVAARLAELERFGLGLDYLERYPGLVRALTPAILQEVAARHLAADHLSMVTAGPEQ